MVCEIKKKIIVLEQENKGIGRLFCRLYTYAYIFIVLCKTFKLNGCDKKSAFCRGPKQNLLKLQFSFCARKRVSQIFCLAASCKKTEVISNASLHLSLSGSNCFRFTHKLLPSDVLFLKKNLYKTKQSNVRKQMQCCGKHYFFLM